MAKYSDLTIDQQRKACRHFGVELMDSEHLAGGAANTSYVIVGATTERYVLTVLDNMSHLKFPVEVLPQLLNYLGAHGIRTNEPVFGLDGQLVETVDGHQFMLKRYVEGDCHDYLPEHLLGAAGATLASVHCVPPCAELPTGARRLQNSEEFLVQFKDTVFADWVRGRLADSQSLLALEGTDSVIHGDYFADNLIIEADNRIAIVDWETASNDIPLLDLGWAIVGFAGRNGRLDANRLSIFMAGYESVRPLSSEERQYLHSAVLYATTLLAYFRYVRHHIRFPNPAKQNLYSEMYDLAESIRLDWPLGQ